MEVVYFIYLGIIEIFWLINKRLKVIFVGVYVYKDNEYYRKKYVSSVCYFGNVFVINVLLFIL